MSALSRLVGNFIFRFARIKNALASAFSNSVSPAAWIESPHSLPNLPLRMFALKTKTSGKYFPPVFVLDNSN